MSEAAQPIEQPEAPAVPTDEELAFTPPEQDPYLPRGKDGKFLKRDAEPEQPSEPEMPAEEEPAPVAAKEEPPEQERAPTAKEVANAKRYRKDLAKRERELNRQSETLAAKQAEIDRLFALRRDNPRAFLEETGLTFRELAEDAVKQDGEDPRDKALRELRQELDDLKGFKKSLSEEREAQKQQANYTADVSAVTDRITTDAEAYPFLAAYGSEKAAAHAVNTFYAQQKTGASPDLYEILETLESELASDYERLSQAQAKRTAASSPAAQAKGAPGRVNGAVKTAKHVADSNGTPPPATLTNRNAAERASPDRALTPEERKRKAAALIVIRD